MRRGRPGVVLGLHRTRPTRDLLADALSCGVTAIDTAFNYDAFGSHRGLAGIGQDVLGQFTLSTKVGFFPGAPGRPNVHSLDPAELRRAVEVSVDDLGRRADVVLLHNPERSIPADPARGSDVLATACATLTDLTKHGWCGTWGISCWDPRPMLHQLDQPPVAPPVLMLRAGLLVPGDVLHTGEQLTTHWDVPERGRWGMSPFAGNSSAAVWDRVPVHAFLDQHAPPCSAAAAAFAATGHLPGVARIAVGTSSAAHLRELVDATALPVSTTQVARYRALLDQHTRDGAIAAR